ncbi:unnamed protein product [Linum trigynum]|uniref:Uncharacterized protein n=1 Tax=Linum trigynum TaxID=586398 RepID=A0AAV2GT05_9ROSI
MDADLPLVATKEVRGSGGHKRIITIYEAKPSPPETPPAASSSSLLLTSAVTQIQSEYAVRASSKILHQLLHCKKMPKK